MKTKDKLGEDFAKFLTSQGINVVDASPPKKMTKSKIKKLIKLIDNTQVDVNKSTKFVYKSKKDVNKPMQNTKNLRKPNVCSLCGKSSDRFVCSPTIDETMRNLCPACDKKRRTMFGFDELSMQIGKNNKREVAGTDKIVKEIIDLIDSRIQEVDDVVIKNRVYVHKMSLLRYLSELRKI